MSAGCKSERAYCGDTLDKCQGDRLDWHKLCTFKEEQEQEQGPEQEQEHRLDLSAVVRTSAFGLQE